MPKLPLPALIGTGAVGSIGIGTALNSREKKKAAQRVAQFNQEEVKDWNRFTDNTARKSFIQQLGKDPMADPKLLQYAENMNRLKTGSKVTELPGDGGSSYQIRKLRGSDRLGCTCNDWRYKKSVAQPGEDLDCKHIKQFKQMSKTAGHVEDRIAERAPGAEAEVNTLRSKLRQMKLRKGQTYHVPLSRGKGYAVIGDIGDRHAVKTVLGPSMQPPGERLKVARAPRDYKREYEQYHAKPEQVENRSLRNQARKKLGLSKGDPREVDHKTPLSRGGGNGHANLRAVSRSANREKFNKIAESSDTTSVVAPLIAGSVVGGGLLSEVPQQLVGNAARSVIKSNSPLSKAEVSALSKQYNIPIEQGEKSFATSKGMTLGKNSASLQTFHHELGHLRDPGRVDRRNLEPGSVRHTLATLRNEGVANIRAVGTGGLRQIPHAISSQTTYLMGAAKRHKKGLAGIALGSGALGTGSLMLRRTKKDEVRK